MEEIRKRRDRLVSKQPINWAFMDLMTPLPWQTNQFTVTNPFVYVTPPPPDPREGIPFDRMGNLYGAAPQVGDVRARDDDVVAGMGDGPPSQQPRHHEPPPPPYHIAVNLAGTMTGRPGGDNRNPMIRHPPYRGPDGRLFYRGSTLPQVVHLPLSGEQAQRPTYGAAAEA
jgi:hypothetical protein